MKRLVPAALRNRAFARLFWSNLLSQFGSLMTFIAIPLIAWEGTGSGSAFAMVMFGGVLGKLVAFPIGGVLADRFDRRRILLVGDVIAMVLVGGILVTVVHEAWALLAVVQFAQNMSNAMTDSAAPALRRDIITDAERTQSNALMHISGHTCALLAPLAGAAIYATWGFGAIIAVDFFTFLGSFVLVCGIRHSRTKAVRDDIDHGAPHAAGVLRHAAATSFADMRGGLNIAARDTFVMVWVLQGIVIGAANTMFNVALVPWLNQSLGGLEHLLGALVATIGASGVVAGIIVARVGERIRAATLVRVGAVILAVGSVGLLGTPPIAVVFVGLALFGVAMAVMNIGFVSLLQKRVASHVTGRVVSLAMFAMVVGEAIGVPISGALVDATSPAVPVSMSAVLFIVSSCAMFLIGSIAARTPASEHELELDAARTTEHVATDHELAAGG